MPLPVSDGQNERSFLRDRAYEALFGAIQGGQLQPGEVLRDDELMDWLGMSRTPIRHALIRLAESGLIEMSAGRQTTVAELRRDRTNRTLFVSGALNEYAIRRATAKLSVSDLERLAQRRDDLRGAIDAGDGVAAARAISAFFWVIVHACGSVVLDEQVDRIDAELARFLQPGASTDAVDVEALLRGVDDVLDAARGQDTQAALTAVRAMYAATHRNFVEQFREPEIS